MSSNYIRGLSSSHPYYLKIKKSVQGAAIMQEFLPYSSLLGNNTNTSETSNTSTTLKKTSSCENSQLSFFNKYLFACSLYLSSRCSDSFLLLCICFPIVL